MKDPESVSFDHNLPMNDAVLLCCCGNQIIECIVYCI